MAAIKNYRIYDPSDPGAKDRMKNLVIARLDHPSGYLPDDRLIDAVNVAIRLGKPLLITGEPGTGKTQLSYSLAFNLQLGPVKKDSYGEPYHQPFRFTAQHNSLAQDLFYRYDSLQHFADANSQKVSGKTTGLQIDKYIRYGALGEAILLAKEKEQRSVVLIDEIDKAPREFPNDLLEALEDFRFQVKETGEPPIEANPDHRPIVIITSNREKMLPEAFLRRCIYYHIEFPPVDKVSQIVRNRLYGGDTSSSSKIRFNNDDLGYLLDHFLEIRDICRKKKPSTSELLGWLQILDTYREFASDHLQKNDSSEGPALPRLTDADREILRLSYSVLAKHESDLLALEEAFLRRGADEVIS